MNRLLFVLFIVVLAASCTPYKCECHGRRPQIEAPGDGAAVIERWAKVCAEICK